MTTRFRITARIALAGALVALAAAATAQDTERGQKMAAEMQKRFAAADKNGDGRLTREEAEAGMPFVFKHFDEIDKAKQGSVALADIAAFAREQRAARKGTTTAP
jgi:Ca2+-binding EF-hand superfamily protein